MSDKFIPNRALEENLDKVPETAGALTITTDNNIYVDFPAKHGGRLKITDIIINDDKPNALNKPGKLYINKNTRDMWIYDKGKEYRVGASGQSVYKTTYNLSSNANIPTSSISEVVNGVLNQNIVTGALLIDNYDNIAFIKSVNNNTITYQLLINNSKSNTLTDNLYIDENYNGKEIGTFEKPFKSWSALYNKCSNLLKNTNSSLAIHLLSDIHIDTFVSYSSSNESSKTHNISFIGEKSNNTKLITNSNLSNISGGEFKNINFEDNDNVIFDKKTETLVIDNCTFKNITLSNCDIISMINCTITGTIKIINSGYVNIENCVTDLLRPTKIEIIGDTTDENSVSDISISNTHCESISVDLTNCRLNRLDISNVVITNSFNVQDTDVLNLHSGLFTGSVNDINLNASNINLGTFSFNNLDINNTSKIKGTIIKDTGLTSKQVYDKKTRKYGNKEFTLEKHLDAIDDKLKTNTDSIEENAKDIEKIINAHVSANTILKIEDIKSYENSKEGSILKYVGLNTAELTTVYNPTINSGKEITLKNENGVDEKYIEVKFSLENASYHCIPYKDKIVINSGASNVNYTVLNTISYKNEINTPTINGIVGNVDCTIGVDSSIIADLNKYYIINDQYNILTEYMVGAGSYYANANIVHSNTSTKVNLNKWCQNISSEFMGYSIEMVLEQLCNTHCLHYNGTQWEMIDRSTLSGPAELLLTSVTKGTTPETDKFTAIIKSSLVASDFITNLNKYTATYNHTMNLFTNDRIVKLSNGWDKLNDIAPTNTLEAINKDLNTLTENAIYSCLKTDSVSYNYPGSETKGVLYNFSVNTGITQLFIAATDKDWTGRNVIYSRFINTTSSTPVASVWTNYLIDANNSIKTNHITNKVVTKPKLSDSLQNTINDVEEILKTDKIAIDNTTLTGNEPKGTIQFVVEAKASVNLNNVKSIKYSGNLIVQTYENILEGDVDYYIKGDFYPTDNEVILIDISNKEYKLAIPGINYSMDGISYWYYNFMADSYPYGKDGHPYWCLYLYIEDNSYRLAWSLGEKPNIDCIILQEIKSAGNDGSNSKSHVIRINYTKK